LALAGTPETRNAECSAFLRRVSAAMIAQGNSESPVLARIRQDRTWLDRDRSAPPAARPPGHSDTPHPRGRPSWVATQQAAAGPV
jgi:hypothetical protein